MPNKIRLKSRSVWSDPVVVVGVILAIVLAIVDVVLLLQRGNAAGMPVDKKPANAPVKSDRFVASARDWYYKNDKVKSDSSVEASTRQVNFQSSSIKLRTLKRKPGLDVKSPAEQGE